MTEEARRRPRGKTSIRKGSRGGQERRPADPERHTRLNPSRDLKALLKLYALRPKKGFGQNFLIDPFALETIVEAAQLTPTDHVLEIGPGLGVLTRELSQRAERVVAIEIDRGLVAALGEILIDSTNVTIIEGDALHIDPAEHFPDHPYKVIANIPYYITASLLRRFFESSRRPTRIVVMIQKEVAERIVATPGRLSLLAISVQFYGVPQIVGRVPASAFLPQPKVDSAILAIDVRPSPLVDIDPDTFFKVVSAGFAMPRKQIHNALPQRIWMPRTGAADALAAAGIDSTRRAQTLSIDEWAILTRVMLAEGLVYPDEDIDPSDIAPDVDSDERPQDDE